MDRDATVMAGSSAPVSSAEPVVLAVASTPKTPVGNRRVSIQVQSVLYNNRPASIERALESLARSAELAIFDRLCERVDVRLGDCSSSPCVNDEQIGRLQAKFAPALNIFYHSFLANLGSARGHNQLAGLADSDFLLVQNPDVIVSPRLLERLIDPFRHAGDVGMVEAKQLPIEHPKDYNPVTGDTGWASTACALIPLPLFRELGGFDADSFFLYCDDVDYSWLTRRAGYRVMFQPAAVVFHDKRLSDAGAWQPSLAEIYYSAEASMILRYKWSREDLTEEILSYFKEAGDDLQKKAAGEFERRRNAGELPAQLDPDHKIAQFLHNFYAPHRYPL